MTKAHLVAHLQAKGLARREAEEAVDTVFEAMKQTLERGNTLKIVGFGTFVPRDKRPRPGVNPQTGEAITIAARRVLRFRISEVLKNALNE